MKNKKGGVEPEDLAQILESATNFENVTVCGLMGMATFTDDPEDVRHEFKLLKTFLMSIRNLTQEVLNSESSLWG